MMPFASSMVMKSTSTPTGPSAVDWRVRFPEGSFEIPKRYLELPEIEMAETFGGADVCAGGTATASTVYGNQAAAKAFDNDNATAWSTDLNSTVDSWIRYTFASAKQINELRIRNSATEGEWGPISLVLEYSTDSGSTWTPLIENDCYPWNASEVKTFRSDTAYTETDHRLWRLRFSDGSGGAYVAVGEIEMRGVASGPDLTAGYVRAFASSTYPGLGPTRAFDDNTSSTEWASSGGSSTNAWIACHLNAAADIVQIVLTSGTLAGERPRHVHVEYSDDQSTWTSYWEFDCGFTGNWQTKTFTKP